MRYLTRTAFLAAGLSLVAAPVFAQGGSPAASGTAPSAAAPTQDHQARTQHQPQVQPARPATGATQATRPATPQNPGGSATGSVQRPATTPTAPQAGSTTPAPRGDQRSQAAPTTPAPSRTN